MASISGLCVPVACAGTLAAPSGTRSLASIAHSVPAFLSTSHSLQKKGTASSRRGAVAVRASVAVEPPSAGADSSALNAKFGGEGIVIDAGLGGLPRVALKASDGSTADVYLYGACTTSWVLPTGEDLLFVRPDAVFTGKKPISGGIPHCFPQFGPGVIQQHGFARNVSWAISSTSTGVSPSVTLELTPSDYSRAMWDYDFKALFTISLGPKSLSTEFVVKNTDSKPFEFTTALHSYFSAAVAGATVQGLKGLQYLNKDPDPTKPIPGTETREKVGFPGFVDCMYLDAPPSLVLENGLGKALSISSTNWNDAVIWNPHLTMEACYKDFVCVENAQLDPVKLAPGETWTATQKLVPQ